MDPDWAHHRKLCSRTSSWMPPTATHPELSAQQHQLADMYVANLTAGLDHDSFAVFPDSAVPGSTIVWRDTWTGRSEVGEDRREGHRLYTETPDGRKCSFWVSDEHCVGSTGISSLSHRKHRTVIGVVVDVSDSEIEIQPELIGQLRFADADMFGRVGADSLQIWPHQIDEFSRLGDSKRAPASALRRVAEMREDDVKSAFATLIGEPYVPNDWGGERSDLNTTRLRLEGKPLEASFVFKGPGAPKKMVIATLGKNGDQIARALTEQPDLVVVQHYGSIDATVRHLLERYCFFETYARQRRTHWMVVDGETTAQILGAYGKL
jgi:hypothetical protein